MWSKRSLLRRQQSLTSSGDTTVRLACLEEGGRERGREVKDGGREGQREEVREGRREGKDGGREGRREGRTEGGREGGKEGEREGEKEGGRIGEERVSSVAYRKCSWGGKLSFQNVGGTKVCTMY